MRLFASAIAIWAGAALAGGCGDAETTTGGGAGGAGGADTATSASSSATAAPSSASSGGDEGGGGAADDCPRARVDVPGGEVLNVRPDPSTTSPPVGTLASGTIVDVVAQVTGESVDGNDLWFSITYGPLSGYISSAFAACTTDQPPDPPDGYYLPLHCGVAATVTQGNNGSTSHNGPTSQYAFDLGVGLNTDILAMADGTVAFIYDQTGPGDPCYNGGGSECVAYANYVVLRHADDTMTAYKHLNQVLVAVGDVVGRGDVIGLSGTTGWSTGRHVHIVREEDCGAASCTSIPLSFVDVPQNGGVPQTNDVVTSGNCP